MKHLIILLSLLLVLCGCAPQPRLSSNHDNNVRIIYRQLDADYQNSQLSISDKENKELLDYLTECAQNYNSFTDSQREILMILVEDIDAYTKYYITQDIFSQEYFKHVHEELANRLGEEISWQN